MATTIGKSARRHRLRRPSLLQERGFFGRSRGHEPRARRIAHDLDGAIEEEPKTAPPAAAAFASGARAIVPVLLALLPFGLAFGAAAAGNGFSAFEALAMSVFVAAGAAQLAAVQLIAAGASVAVVVLTVLVINLRLTLYSASLAPHFQRLPVGWK